MLNHKHARFLMAIFIENGLIPSLEVSKVASNSKFKFLSVLDSTAANFQADYPSLTYFEK